MPAAPPRGAVPPSRPAPARSWPPGPPARGSRCAAGNSPPLRSQPTSPPGPPKSPPGARPEVRRLIHRFLEHLEGERGLSPHTLRAYEGDLLRFLEFLARDFLARPPEEVRPEAVDGLAVRSFLASLHAQGLERRSQARALSAVRSLLRFACREGTLASNPAQGVPTPKLPKTLPRHLRPGEVEILLAAPAGAAAALAPAGDATVAGAPAATPGRTPAVLAAALARRDSALFEVRSEEHTSELQSP